ncbi:MAG: hypothetical protein COV75_08910, partial [Candidatus Omnitrophica bacterium CG11_big_fil_rev_8_21_14_0_20_63_9]
GLDGAYGQTAQATSEWCFVLPKCVTRHTAVLTGLDPLQNYQLRVKSDDAHGHEAVPVGNLTASSWSLWTQTVFKPTPLPFISACVSVGAMPGCVQYVWPHEMSWIGNELLIHFNATAEDLTRGDLVFEANVIFVAQHEEQWVDLEVAAGTDPSTLAVVNPGGVTIDRAGRYAVAVPANLFSPGVNYLRLRGLTIDADEMGYGKVAPVAVWDRLQLRFAQLQPPTLTDEQLLDRAQAQAARYFWDQAFNTNGFVRDITNSYQASTASTGFGLAALAVMAERAGTSPEWTITAAQAQARAQQILDAAVALQNQQAANPEEYGKAGLLYHFVEPDGRRWKSIGGEASDVEVSTIDTAIFLAGALTAGEYFGGTVQARANEFLDNLNWSYFFNPATQQFHHAWKPEPFNQQGYTVIPSDGQGRLSNVEWDRPGDETLLVNLLALATDPASAAFRSSLYAWPRVTRSYAGYNLVNTYRGSMFTYLFGHAFFDLDEVGADDPASAGFPQQPSVDWFINARDGILANRQYVIDQAANFLTYGPEQWGLAASTRPDGTYFGDNGAKPAECDFNLQTGQCGPTPPAPQSGEPHHDGTVPPYASIGSMPIVRTSPSELLSNNLGFQALRHYHTAHYSGLWGPYGPLDALQTELRNGQPFTSYGWLYVGIDVGPEALLIEQYRSGHVADALMRHPRIRQALHQHFPSLPSAAPVLAAIGPKTVVEGNELVITLSAMDLDGDALTFSAQNLPAGATLTGDTFRWTPDFAQGGANYPVTFRVSDSVLTDEEIVIIAVQQAPAPTNFITVPALGSVVDRTQPIVVQGTATAPAGSYISSVSFRVDDVTNNPATFVIAQSLLSVPSQQVFNWGTSIYANAAPGHKLRVQTTAIGPTGTSNLFTLYINPDGTVASCYVLTAAYGTPYAADIQALNALRERFVPMGTWHQTYLDWYDRQGPRMAAVVRRSPFLQGLVRGLAKPAAAFARWRLQASR